MDVSQYGSRPSRALRLAALAVAALAALSLTASVSARRHEAGATPKPAANQTLVVRQVIPQALDPAFFTTYNNYTLVDNLFEPLVRTTRGGRKLLPALALSWSSSQGGKVWTFKLR